MMVPELSKFVGAFASNLFSRGLIAPVGFLLLALLKAQGERSSSQLLDGINTLTTKTWKDAEVASVLKRLQRYELITHVSGSGKRGDPKRYEITDTGITELRGRSGFYRTMADFLEEYLKPNALDATD